MKNAQIPEGKSKFYKHRRGKSDDYSDDSYGGHKSGRHGKYEEGKETASYAHFSHRLVAEKHSQGKGVEEAADDILSGSESKKKKNEIKQIVKETKQIMSDSDDDVIKVKREV